MNRGKAVLILALFCLIAAGIYWGAGLLQRDAPQARSAIPEEPTVEWRGERFAKKRRLTTLLLMGIDLREQDAGDTAMFARNGGQADFLLLLAVDDETRTVYPLHIDRDTMAEIAVTTIMGRPSGSRVAQICLSYGFGTTPAQSCALTEQAVRGLLGGERIDHYLSLGMGGIGRLNDAVGGVTVTVTDDLTAMDPALSPGATVTLRGGQAESFVRSRIGVGSGTNEERMARQRVYLASFLETLLQGVRAGGESYLNNLLAALDETVQKDVGDDWLLALLLATSDYQWAEIATIPGAHVLGADGFTEYHADADALRELVMRLYYKPVPADSEPST